MANTPEEQRLRELAKAATPGPWEVGDHQSLVVSPCPCCGLIATCAQFGPGEGPLNYNSDYIAAANPKAILVVLDSLAEARKRAEVAERRVAELEQWYRDTAILREIRE